ncbi:MAG: RnfABCDGE type electron transport complex subunit B [Desulfovibrionales bacterium]
MDLIIISIIVLAAMGFVAAVLLSASSRLLHVDEDPRVEAVANALPGTNCGGCGYAGCDGYAVAVLYDPDVPPNKCCAGDAELAERVAWLSDKAVTESESRVAFRRCDRSGGNVRKEFEYSGVPTCRGIKMVQDGPYACKYSCFGLGDCVDACPFNAMSLQNGMVSVDPEACTACGKCISVCPNSIMELVPKRSRVMVFCASKDKGKQVSSVCDVGCISCMKCIRKCPAKAISIKDSRIHIDHQACLEYGPGCEEACVAICPRGILRCLGYSASDMVPAPQEANSSATV